MKVKDMPQKIRPEFIHYILGKNLSLEHRLYLLIALATILLSAMGSWFNTKLGLPLFASILPLISIVVAGACVFYSYYTQRWRGIAMLVVIFNIFVLMPFLWFTTSGPTGSTICFVVLNGLMIVTIFNGWLRNVTLATTLLLYCCFIVLEMNYPGIVMPYPSREAQYIDLLLGLIGSFIASAGISYMSINSRQQAQAETNRLLRQLETLSLTDSLTGIHNRRFLAASIDEEIRNAYDSGQPLTLCILDIDHFKRVNDTCGHDYGDMVLIKFAQTLIDNLGPDEIFGRYGGEEFLIIFKNCPVDMAVRKLETLRSAFKSIQWKHDGKQLAITISGGVSTYSKGMHNSLLIKNADTNLYRAKDNGRDQIVT